MAAALAENLANLEIIRQSLPADVCEQIVTAILGARRVLIAGFGTSGYLSGMLAHGLELHYKAQSPAGVAAPRTGRARCSS